MRMDFMDETIFEKTYVRKTCRSDSENPDACISFICLIIVVFPASPAPIHPHHGVPKKK
jgi:hypothetical protein